jgi:sensor domain CHASE-containing protein
MSARAKRCPARCRTFVSQLGATLNDYAAWDDAATNVYATDGMDWTVSNYGEMSVNSALFDMAIVIDDDKKPIMVYRDGKPMDGSLQDFFSPALWTLFDKVKAAGPQDVPEASGFISTQAGIAVAGVALVREKSGALVAAPASIATSSSSAISMPARSTRSARPMSSVG